MPYWIVRTDFINQLSFTDWQVEYSCMEDIGVRKSKNHEEIVKIIFLWPSQLDKKQHTNCSDKRDNNLTLT